MSYQGRSPIKDVMRSVVLGAGMISPALIEACATNTPTTTPLPPTSGTAVASTPPVDSAPPTEVVRPRPNPTGTNMPTRGFSGAARARG